MTEQENSALSRSVLIADDDEDILQLVAFRISRAGYNVIKARNGEEALNLTVEEKPDLVVLDIGMPKLNGYEVTSQIREHPSVSRTPIIMLTANVQDSSVTKGFNSGADDYIKKPFSPQELLLRIKTALGEKE